MNLYVDLHCYKNRLDLVLYQYRVAASRNQRQQEKPFPRRLHNDLLSGRFARGIEGVRRIALTGSLATGKEFPKDIDILVTVSDDCDLAPLARLGRQLSGHMNSHRAGADVFRASEDGRYLGRTCPWRDCGPDYRTRCDALHCGARPYLHDDFNAVHLEEEVIAQPPVVLWPNLAAAEGVLRDVREELVERLARDGAT